MKEFLNGVQLDVNEGEYQAALLEHRDGLVFGLKTNLKGQFPLHNAACITLSYDLAATNSPHPQTRRTGKVLFHGLAELEAWLAAKKPGVEVGDLNRCSRCNR
jgi:hypothetical protein